MGNEQHLGLHPAIKVEIHGEQVDVDEGIVDLVCWMNSLPGVNTYTSCQGCAEFCSPDAFVGFTCDDSESLNVIIEFVMPYAVIIKQSDEHNRLSFPNPEDLVRLNQERFTSDNWR
jgi:hypothetical protein